jgi:hypothetical protein
MRKSLLPFCLLLTQYLATAADLPLENPSFEEGLGGWTFSSQEVDAVALEVEGRSCAAIRVAPGQKTGFPHLYQDAEISPGQLVEATVECQGQRVGGGRGAYLSLSFHTDTSRIDFIQSERLYSEGEWDLLRVSAVAPPESKKVRLALILHGQGEAFFDHARWSVWPSRTAPPGAGEQVRIEITPEVVCEGLIGFGFEDDGWFFNEDNTRAGVDLETDAPLREGRIEWMDPDWVRMFFWHKDWCPSGDWKSFDFETDNMRSHYRSLEVYQRLGTRVNVTGVEWGMDPNLYRDAEAFAQALGEFFDHLIKVKGFTCIRDWTLSNEPNDALGGRGYSFADYARVLQAVSREFDRRGLELNIVGSDDAAGPLWFAETVSNPTTSEVCDLFVSHHYFKRMNLPLIPDFFAERFAALAKSGSGKPFAVGEFGFQDQESGTLENPIMRTYPYAPWSMAFAIEGLNRGTAGFAIWCLHEILYPGGGKMTYGLWDDQTKGWAVRPVYHAWSLLTRLTEAGEKVRRCGSSHPDWVKGALAGDTFFWVNLAESEVRLEVVGEDLSEWTAHTENRLEGDRECGFPLEQVKGTVLLPPLSFGHASLKLP